MEKIGINKFITFRISAMIIFNIFIGGLFSQFYNPFNIKGIFWVGLISAIGNFLIVFLTED